MNKLFHGSRTRLVVLSLSALGLTGCASVDFERSLAQSNQTAVSFTQGKLALATTSAQRAEMDKEAADLLQKPLDQNSAVHLALLNSPNVQAMLAQSWADAASAAQSGRITNPLFTFERVTLGSELELGRLLSFGLLDLLTLPQRYDIAQRRIGQAQLQLSLDTIEQVTQIRQVWVKAVAAQQGLVYAKQVFNTAEASAELARRLLAVGNYSRLAHAKQQIFYAESATQWAAAQHLALASREELVRVLGLNDAQAAQLQLPNKLPDLPKSPRSTEEISQLASKERLDIKLAKATFDASAKAQGLNGLTSLIDIELGVRHDTVNAEGTKKNRKGYEIALRLPLFDWGGGQRDAMNAQTLVAANRLEATVRAAGSNLRSSYSAYRTAYDMSRHYRDEVLPLRKVIAEENTLRYNGMLISVFELLADSREQISSVISAIAAEQQFWLSDAALQAELMGKPSASMISSVTAGSASADAGH
ncbi:TolC family protein [Iodobacter sp. CM08]|uniref:TolC family protein n=1 Tax=Iodobacter sp. CM08 TaxID=3085902 RepID=UPI002982323D|nr:TolC family protein [Iodobacter sp. CM08]MDW5417268.1 TolC family protein [Iodobacter sp. CM08]